AASNPARQQKIEPLRSVNIQRRKRPSFLAIIRVRWPHSTHISIKNLRARCGLCGGFYGSLTAEIERTAAHADINPPARARLPRRIRCGNRAAARAAGHAD